MKFTLKLVLSIIAIIACILACSRYFVVRQNFMHSIEKRIMQNTNQHTYQRYYIESNVIGLIQQGEEITNDKIADFIKSLYSYLGENSERIALYNENGELIFSNFDIIEDINIKSFFSQQPNYYIRKVEDKSYMLFVSSLTNTYNKYL